MVRTKAETRAVVAKTSRPKNAARPANSASFNDGDGTGKGRERAGGNLYCPRDTPGWQKPITSFFVQPNDAGESSDREREKDGMEIENSGSPITSSTSNGGKTLTG